MAVAVSGLSRPTSAVDCAGLLMGWREEEIAAAQGRFGWLAREEVEEMYDETADALRVRAGGYESELHLRKQLLLGLKWRAARRLRDRCTRERIVDEQARELYREGEERTWEADPERALLAAEDNFLAGEFVADLTEQEGQVFVLVAHGRSWRAIATALDIPATTARNLTRAVERKRERFLALYESGRLCGFRSSTIEQLIAGGEANDLALRQAVAHLRHCRECKLTHRITGAQLRARFSDSAAVLLPFPAASVGHRSLLDRWWPVLERPLRLFERVLGGGPARERIVEVTVGGAAATKTAAAVVGVIAVLATGVTLGVRAVAPGNRAPVGRHGGGIVASGSSASSGLISSQGLLDLGRLDAQLRPVARHVPGESGPGRVIEREPGPGRVISSDGEQPGGRAEGRVQGGATGNGEVPLRPVEGGASRPATSAPSQPHVHQEGGGGLTP